MRAGGGGDQVRELWEWAGMAANEQARKHEWGGDYTAEEIEGGVENVVTGLRDEESEEEEEEGGEEEGGRDWSVGVEGRGNGEGGGKALSMDEILRFLMRGEEPKK